MAKKKTAKKLTDDTSNVGPRKTSVFAGLAQALAEKQRGAKSTRTTVTTLDKVQLPVVELPHLALQYLFGNRHMRKRTLIDIVGDTGAGKSYFAVHLAGILGKTGDALHINFSEAKPSDPIQIRRAMSADRAVADALYGDTLVTTHKSIMTWNKALTDITQGLRGRGLFKNKPVLDKDRDLVSILDSKSKMMSKPEADGLYDSNSVHMTKKVVGKGKSVAEVQPTAMAREYTAVMRRMGYLNEDLGTTQIFISHKRQRIEMQAAPGAAKFAAIKDRTKPVTDGGKAITENASYRFAFSIQEKLALDTTGNAFGKQIYIHLTKSSFSSDANRGITVNFRTVYPRDTDVYLQPGMEWDECFGDMLVDRGIMSASVSDGLYTVRELDLFGVTAAELHARIWTDEAARSKVGAALGIQGYAGYNTGGVAVSTKPAGETTDADEEEEEGEDDGETEEGGDT